jgi:hypothetical protein
VVQVRRIRRGFERIARDLARPGPFAAGIDDGTGSPPITTIHGFSAQRRAFLLVHPEVVAARR